MSRWWVKMISVRDRTLSSVNIWYKDNSGEHFECSIFSECQGEGKKISIRGRTLSSVNRWYKDTSEEHFE